MITTMCIETKQSAIEGQFIHGGFSFVDCELLRIKGNVYFGNGIAVKGNVTIANQWAREAHIPEGTIITKDLFYS
jgi:hypothetical protein